jgi:DNA repair exonuclease SbcCD nuclease subunit
MAMPDYQGILFIGDPHLSSRVPGFRKDDYPKVTLAKLAWCLDYARDELLLPAILGDLFDRPRDNANWLMGDLLALLGRQKVLGIYGNHDCRENGLGDDDSMTVVAKAAKLHMVDADGPWRGIINGCEVVVGGTSWGQWLPDRFETDAASMLLPNGKPLVFWMAHHDVILPGYEEQGRFKPREIPGIDVVVNGHIHRPLVDGESASTLWITPGNISRISRSDTTREHVPAVLRIDISMQGWERKTITVPHAPFDEVFHEEVAGPVVDAPQSAFIQGLAELQARRTETGAGLMSFIKTNVGQFDQQTADEIILLAQEVTADGNHEEVK